ncbi:MAG: LuxR C-terminal-related transcriptional regulator [Syntrophales bacterium]
MCMRKKEKTEYPQIDEMKKNAIEWLERAENMQSVKKAAYRLTAGTPYSIEDCVQTAYCNALDAVDLMLRKKGELTFPQCFWALFHFEMKTLRGTSVRAVSIEDMPCACQVSSHAESPQDLAERHRREEEAILRAMSRLSRIKCKTITRLMEGKTRAQIARELSLTESSVKYHVRTATKKIIGEDNQ